MAEIKKEGFGSKLLSNAGTIVGGLTTLGSWLGIGEKRQDRRQLEQQGKLNRQGAETAKDLADYEQNLKLKMWKDTNYTAQLAEAEKAGVSKAAAIGGSGTGTQGASVGGVPSGTAADAASSMNAATGRGAAGLQTAAQLNLMKAQADNLNADTRVKNTDADKKAGVDTDNVKADTDNKILDNLRGRLEYEIRNNSKDDVSKQIQAATSKAISEAQSATSTARVGLETQDATINKIKQEAIGAMIQNAAMKQNIELDKAKINEIAVKLQQGWAEQEIAKRGQDVSKENMEELTKTMLISSGINAAGNIIGDLIDLRQTWKGRQGKNITKKVTNSDKGWKTETTTNYRTNK